MHNKTRTTMVWKTTPIPNSPKIPVPTLKPPSNNQISVQLPPLISFTNKKRVDNFRKSPKITYWHINSLNQYNPSTMVTIQYIISY